MILSAVSVYVVSGPDVVFVWAFTAWSKTVLQSSISLEKDILNYDVGFFDNLRRGQKLMIALMDLMTEAFTAL